MGCRSLTFSRTTSASAPSSAAVLWEQLAFAAAGRFATIRCDAKVSTALQSRRKRSLSHFTEGKSAMKCMFGSLLIVAILTGPIEARDMVREVAGVERASPGKPYDYIVHVRNIPAIAYNPEVREDRDRMAVKALRGQCKAGRIVGEDKLDTEIWGITSSYPDYVVLVKCRNA
jgi:hypothetical protein